jgi:hypothetical protein
MWSMRARRVATLVVTVGLALALPARAMFLLERDHEVPVERLLRNSARALRAHPDAAGYAVVARLHVLAAAPWQAGQTTANQRAHLEAAIADYRAALAMEPRRVRWHGLGYALHEAARIGVPAVGTRTTVERQSIAAYLRADDLARTEISGDEGANDKAKAGAKKKRKPKKDPPAPKDPKQDRPPRGDLETPIIFGAGTVAEDLLDRTRVVGFDLAGDGGERRWPWVKPSTGILVWDPSRTGRITSARQLFGSVSWWIFWSDGYRALAALDDDGDAWLAGRELEGVGVWRDANGNGVSDPGEVVPAAEASIVRIAVRPDAGNDGVLANARGVVTRDGTYPTFDWKVAPLPDGDGRLARAVPRRGTRLRRDRD